MQKLLTKRSKSIIITVTVVLGLFLMVSAITMLVKYKKEITEKSSSVAKYYTLLTGNALQESLNDYTIKAIEIASTVDDDVSDVVRYLDAFTKDDYGIKFSRHFDKDGVFYDEYGDVYASDKDLAVEYRRLRGDKAGFIGIFDDDICVDEGTMSVIGFYAPVNNSSTVSGIVNYYTRQTLVEIFKNNVKSDKAEFTVICTTNGKVISGLDVKVDNDLFSYFRNKFGKKDVVDKIGKYIESGEDGIVSASSKGEDYLISVGANKDKLVDMAIVEMYKEDVLFSSSYNFIQAIIATIILFVIMVLGAIIYLIKNSYSMRKTILNMETNDLTLDCLNRYGFEVEAKKILDANPNSYFAVVVVQIRYFSHIKEICSENEINNLLKYIKLICVKTLRVEEQYGYDEEGAFLFLLHGKDKKDIVERLKVHSFLSKQFKTNADYDVLIRYGICECSNAPSTAVAEMIDCAEEANSTVSSATVENAGMTFNFYSDELRQFRLENENMELRMEDALKSDEFQVFYQPKYNLNKNKQDGCEALVRWYDKKEDKYNKPALFMKLFETNGFVVKLDKYVYTKVCEYISYAISKGMTVFPVSVNISRVTAIQSDFVEFYTGIKKKYHIPDGYLVIEFTESFAYENYETLLSIVNKLHDNGFQCSIDDFGCGYSSYRILKTLPMDEIKLDKFFLEQGTSAERDDCIFKSIIDLAKQLGMKVTQEGVETKEEAAKIRELGCDVLQGYYYSHPLGLNDYLNFVGRTKEHNV